MPVVFSKMSRCLSMRSCSRPWGAWCHSRSRLLANLSAYGMPRKLLRNACVQVRCHLVKRSSGTVCLPVMYVCGGGRVGRVFCHMGEWVVRMISAYVGLEVWWYLVGDCARALRWW